MSQIEGSYTLYTTRYKFFDFVAPEFVFFELGKRMDKLLLKTKLSKEEIAEILGFLKEVDRNNPR